MDQGRVGLTAIALPLALAVAVPAASAAGVVRFQDVAAAAGVDFVLENHPTPPEAHD